MAEHDTRLDEDMGRISAFESPQWRRRTVAIEVLDHGPGRLSATVTCKKWSPGRVMRGLVDAAPGYWLERAMRKMAGRKTKRKVVFRAEGLRMPAVLRYGDDTFQAEEIFAVALQGWQEESGQDRVWDIMLLGPDRDLVVGHDDYDEAHDLAEKLADVLGVPLKESSVVGGQTSVQSGNLQVRDMRYDAPRPDGWRHTK
jgi:hypothetical protein